MEAIFIASHGSSEVYTFNSMKKADFLSMHECTLSSFSFESQLKPKVPIITPE